MKCYNHLLAADVAHVGDCGVCAFGKYQKI